MLQKTFRYAREGTLVPKVKSQLKKKMGFSYDKKKTLDGIERLLKQPERKAIQSTEVIIQRYFRMFLNKNYGLPHDYISKLSNLIVTRSSNASFSHDSYDEVLGCTKRLSPELMSSEDWKNLCHIAISTGLFRLGGVARAKAIENSYLTADSSSATLSAIKDAFKAAVDQMDFETAIKLLSLIENKANSEKEVNNCYRYYYTLKGSKDKSLKLSQTYYSDVDSKYAEYLKNKNVAVVGPAPSDEDVANEIDSHDVVIRLNYRGANLLPITEEFGSKIDVSYYNGENALQISENDSHDFFKEIDFAVFKSIKHDFQEKLSKKNCGRVNYSPNNMLYCGSANMLQHVLYDLLLFGPKKIKVYKANFFLAKKAYHNGYSIHQDRAGIKWRWQGFANHDPITQLNFARPLWNNNLIEVDKACASVLGLGNEYYLSCLEEIYVETPLKLLGDAVESKWKSVKFQIDSIK